MQLYRISFPGLTEKAYIGISAAGAAKRFKAHCASRKNYPIVLALRKHGHQNALLEILDEFSEWDELYAAEQRAIATYGTKAPFGYNLTDGGKGAHGFAASDERKKKIGDAHRGRKFSPERCAKMAEISRGQDKTKQIEAMRLSHLGKPLPPHRKEALREVWIGRKHSEETKKRMSESAKKRKASPATREKMSNALKGRKMSEESLEKRRATLKRKKCPPPL